MDNRAREIHGATVPLVTHMYQQSTQHSEGFRGIRVQGNGVCTQFGCREQGLFSEKMETAAPVSISISKGLPFSSRVTL